MNALYLGAAGNAALTGPYSIQIRIPETGLCLYVGR